MKRPYPSLSSSAAWILITLGMFACGPPLNGSVDETGLGKRTGRTQQDATAGACLSEKNPIPNVSLHLGLLNGKTAKMARPGYPIQARRMRIAGTVRVNVIFEISTGIIVWADISKGHRLLRNAVSAVISQTRLLSTHVNGKASGHLIYEFRLPRKVIPAGS